MLPQVREWIEQLWQIRDEFAQSDRRLAGLTPVGFDRGGPLVNEWVALVAEIRRLLREFHRRGILLKDVDRGLVDFPTLRGDREILFCWEMGESDIEHWHELHTGFKGREKL